MRKRTAAAAAAAAAPAPGARTGVRRSPRLLAASSSSLSSSSSSGAPARVAATAEEPQERPERPDEAVALDGGKAEVRFPHGTLPRTFEAEKETQGFRCVVGVDEAGRGPLAGPVVAAACFVPVDVRIAGVHDSKKLNEAQREAIFARLTAHPRVRFAVHVNSPRRIDEINILQASLESMALAVAALPADARADFAFVDGNRLPAALGVPAAAVIKGDAKVFSVAAASVIAKVTRDRIMRELDAQFPLYGFAQHKGYPTAAHVAAIAKHGACAAHRMTFAPLRPKEAAKPAKRRRT